MLVNIYLQYTSFLWVNEWYCPPFGVLVVLGDKGSTGGYCGILYGVLEVNPGNPPHPGLTRVNSIRFLLFETKVFWSSYNSTIFYLIDFVYSILFYSKKYQRQKAKKLCLMGQIVIDSHRFLEY